jgi:hypothetical protein
VEIEDSVTRSLDKGKGMIQITQGGSDFEGPTLTIEHLSSTMLSVGVIKKTNSSGEAT